MAQRGKNRTYFLPGLMNRRDFLYRAGVVTAGAAALPILAACGDVQPQGEAPGAAGPSPTPAAGAGAQPTPTEAAAGTPEPEPTPVGGIERAKSDATVDGTLQVVQDQDFHPDHNEFLRSEIIAYCEANDWPIEVTFAAGFQGGGDLNQRLVASVQAGNAPDLLIKDHQVRNLHTLGVVQSVTALTEEMMEEYGDAIPGMRDAAYFDDEWWGVPFFTRAGGMYVRQDIFAEHGLDIEADTEYYDKLRETALALSDPANNRWGWGMTVNRSGDGNGLVQNVLFRFGAHVQDETGEIVTFNSPETIAAFEFLKETYTDPQWAPMLPPGVLSWTDPSNNEAFLAGQIVITANAGTLYAKAVFDQVPFVDDIAFIPQPKRFSDSKRLDSLGGTRFHIIEGARNREAAEDLIRHLLSLPVQQKIWDISRGYALPAYETGWDDPIITSEPNSVRAESIAWNPEGFTGLPWPGPRTAAIESIAGGTFFTDMVSEVIQGRPIEEVVQDYHRRFVQIFQDFGFRGE